MGVMISVTRKFEGDSLVSVYLYIYVCVCFHACVHMCACGGCVIIKGSEVRLCGLSSLLSRRQGAFKPLFHQSPH